MLSCTSNINWFINTFDSSIDEITGQLKNLMVSKNLINNCPYYLPYLTGERTPINDPHARASFHNMGIETDRPSLVYSLIEGISFGLYDNYQALSKTGIKLDNLFVIGGGSKNEYWIKLLASILDRDLAITEASDAMAAYGAARLAFLGFNNLHHSEVLKPPTVKKIIEKDSNLNSLLKDRFNDWKNYYVR
jgi:xylulokinase